MHKSVKYSVISRIYGRGRGSIVSATDFLADFKRADIDKALSLLSKEGVIERVSQGVYYYPEYSELLKQNTSPQMMKVAEAIARKFDWNIQPTGNTALNYFGLSTQIPAKYIYLSDGPNRKYTICQQGVEFKHTKLTETKLKHIESKLLVQAIRSLSRDGVTTSEANIIKDHFNAKMLGYIYKDTAKVSGWIRDIILQICNGINNE